MSNSINVKCTVNSSVRGTEAYALGIANYDYDVTTEANIQAFRSFIITNKGQTNYDGIVKLTSNVTGQDFHQGEGDEVFEGTLTRAFADVDSATDASIVVQDDYVNFVYSAVNDGLNKSLWTMSYVTKKYLGIEGPVNATNFPAVPAGGLVPVLNYPEPTSPGKYISFTSSGSWKTTAVNQFVIENVPGRQYTFELGNVISSNFDEVNWFWGFGFLPTTYTSTATVYNMINIFAHGHTAWSGSTDLVPDQQLSYVKVTVPQTLGDLKIDFYTKDSYAPVDLYGSVQNSGYPNDWGNRVSTRNTNPNVNWRFIISSSISGIYIGNINQVN